MDNERTIRYTIKEDGFEYHFLKQEMRSGKCKVSKSRHPVEEVEILKRDLLQKGYLVDKGDYYALHHGCIFRESGKTVPEGRQAVSL